MYHNVEKMISVGVLEKEKILCDKIIEYKIIIGAGYDHLKKKKIQLILELIIFLLLYRVENGM